MGATEHALVGSTNLIDEGAPMSLWSRSLNVLIVEDECLVALDLEDTVRSLGCQVVGIADSHGSAMSLCTGTTIDLGLVDLNLLDGPTGPFIASYLVREHAAAVVFLTANPESLPADFSGAYGVLPKPYRHDCIGEVIGFALSLRRSFGVPPDGFLIAPWLHRTVSAAHCDPDAGVQARRWSRT